LRKLAVGIIFTTTFLLRHVDDASSSLSTSYFCPSFSCCFFYELFSPPSSLFSISPSFSLLSLPHILTIILEHLLLHSLLFNLVLLILFSSFSCIHCFLFAHCFFASLSFLSSSLFFSSSLFLFFIVYIDLHIRHIVMHKNIYRLSSSNFTATW